MICPYCQTSNEPGWAFCRSCGSPLSEESPTPALETPVNPDTPTIPVSDPLPPNVPAQPESAASPIAGKPLQPVIAPVAQPVIEPVAQPVIEPVAQPVIEPVAQPYNTPLMTQPTVAMSSDTPLAAPTLSTGQARQSLFTPGVSIGLAVAGGVVLVLAVLEHYLLRGIQLLPHLAVLLTAVAVVLLGAGVYGLITGNRSRTL